MDFFLIELHVVVQVYSMVVRVLFLVAKVLWGLLGQCFVVAKQL